MGVYIQMITQAIFDVLLFPVLVLLKSMPSFTLSLPSVVFDPLVSVVNSLGYVVPVKKLLPILVMSSTLQAAQTGWALMLRFKSFIPTMGD